MLRVSLIPITAMVTIAAVTALVSAARSPLYIGGFMPFKSPHTSVPDVTVVGPPIRLAVDLINNSTELLPDYELVLQLYDTENKIPVALKNFFHMVNANITTIFMLGPIQSAVASHVCVAAPGWNIVQMSFFARSSVLTDRRLYPFFFRTLQDDAALNPLRLQIVRKFGWRKIAIIFQETTGEIFDAAIPDFKKNLMADGIEILALQSVNRSNYAETFTTLQEVDARIIFISLFSTTSEEFFCEAYRRGFYGSKYVWILPGYISQEWLKSPSRNSAISCTSEQITKAIEGHLSVQFLEANEDTPVLGVSVKDFYDYVTQETGVIHDTASYAFDAMLAIGYVLHAASRDRGLNLSEFTYGNATFSTIFAEEVIKLAFTGISGKVGFNALGSRVGETVVEQYQGMPLLDFTRTPRASLRMNVVVSKWNRSICDLFSRKGPYVTTVKTSWRRKTLVLSVLADLSSSLEFFKRYGGVRKVIGQLSIGARGLDMGPNPVVWPGLGKKPRDGAQHMRKPLFLPLASTVLICVLSGLGFAATCAVIAFNFKFSHLQYIRLSSPKMNNVVAIGCSLGYISVIFYSIDGRQLDTSAYGIMCHARLFLLCAAYSLAFGALFVKTWRVHRIMGNKKLEKIKLKDYHLLAWILLLVAIDLIFLIVRISIDPFQHDVTNLPLEVDSQDSDLILEPYIEKCQCNKEEYWFGAILVYKGLLLLFGLFLAWETRKISVPALNDSKYIGMSVYNLTIIGVVGVPVGFIISDEFYVSSYVISSLFILVAVTITLCLVFVPKMVAVYLNPTGEVDMRLNTTRTQVDDADLTVGTVDGSLNTSRVTPMTQAAMNIAMLRRLELTVAERESQIEQLKVKLSSKPNGYKSTDSSA